MSGFPYTYGDNDDHKIDLSGHKKTIKQISSTAFIVMMLSSPAFAVDAGATHVVNAANATKTAQASAALLALNAFDAASCSKGISCLKDAVTKGATQNTKTTAIVVCTAALVWCAASSVQRTVLMMN